jgi:hypothetical protein
MIPVVYTDDGRPTLKTSLKRCCTSIVALLIVISAAARQQRIGHGVCCDAPLSGVRRYVGQNSRRESQKHHKESNSHTLG